MEEKKVEILYDHYKDTFENIKIYLQRRNLYTLICLGVLGLLSFQITNPNQTIAISEQIVNKQIENIVIDFNYINNVLIFGLFWIAILYFQINFLIEKQYKYLSDIEDKLCNIIIIFKINREGSNYQKKYHFLSKIVHRVYTVVFPLTLSIVAIIKWWKEKNSFVKPLVNGHFWFDSFFLFLIVFTSLLYFYNRNFGSV